MYLLRKYEGPDGKQEWHNVRRGGDPDYSLEQQVQHMIGGVDQQQSSGQNYASNQNYSSNQNYASANQLTTYKVSK